ncbi:MAG: dockerin type I domain-containing protein [Euryarchaeota archaeon]|nr:dockerin type I domain-containing protein [Euryarchaeota archaeon]
MKIDNTVNLLIIAVVTVLLITSLSATAESGNITALANTTSDASGNYTFTDIPAGDYVISVAYYTPAMGGKWFTGRTYTSVDGGAVESDVKVWLTFGNKEDANNIQNASIDSSSLTGTSTISGQTLAHKMGGEVVAMTNATVIISSYLKGDLNCDGSLTSTDALIILRMSAGSREPVLAGDMNEDYAVTSLDALMILHAE